MFERVCLHRVHPFSFVIFDRICSYTIQQGLSILDEAAVVSGLPTATVISQLQQLKRSRAHIIGLFATSTNMVINEPHRHPFKALSVDPMMRI